MVAGPRPAGASPGRSPSGRWVHGQLAELVPDQGFVSGRGVRPAVGCVETLSQGDVLVLVLFASVPICDRVARLLRGLGHTIRLTLQRSLGERG